MACVLGQGRAVTYHLGIVRVTALHAKFLAIGPECVLLVAQDMLGDPQEKRDPGCYLLSCYL